MTDARPTRECARCEGRGTRRYWRGGIKPDGEIPCQYCAATGRVPECPDGGTCHHGCAPSAVCWRTGTCEPLTAHGPDWPA